jgi:hypothetical protein
METPTAGPWQMEGCPGLVVQGPSLYFNITSGSDVAPAQLPACRASVAAEGEGFLSLCSMHTVVVVLTTAAWWVSAKAM